MKRLFLLAFSLLLVLPGCEQKKETPKVAVEAKPAVAVELKLPEPKRIFEEPMATHRFELPSEALQAWRHTGTAKPALVLFSNHPFLDKVTEEQKTDIAALIRTGNRETFRQRGSYYRTNPALMPSQAVSAALDNDLFSEIIWVIPTRVKMEELSLDILRQQVVEAGFLTEEEGKNLTYAEGVTRGSVRGIPFRAVHPDALPDLAEPIVLHIDTGYFKGMFKNEVATPLYDILHQTIMRIAQNSWNVYAATLSWSTEESMFSLDVRFLITAMAKMIENPELLQKMPAAWKLHANAMYMGNMYMEAKARDIFEEAAVNAPDDPTIIYALSQVRFQQGRSDEAFALLDSVVKLDPGYATAYTQLAETGIEKGQLEKALELSSKAASHFPENPFLLINKINLQVETGRNDEAISTAKELQKLNWSEYFHPGSAEKLKGLVEFARNPQPMKKAAPASENKP